MEMLRGNMTTDSRPCHQSDFLTRLPSMLSYKPSGCHPWRRTGSLGYTRNDVLLRATADQQRLAGLDEEQGEGLHQESQAKRVLELALDSNPRDRWDGMAI